MSRILPIATLILTSIAMALSLAHALELPGKLRLDKPTYLAMQKVYYPGFTIGGASEPLAILATLVLLFATSQATEFWIVLAALIALVVAHAIFWLVTQPVNRHWLKGHSLDRASARFFGNATGATLEWTTLRDRWEYSHVARAALTFVAFVLLLIAATQ